MNVRKLPGCDGGDAGELVEVEGGRAREVRPPGAHAAGGARRRWRSAFGPSAAPARARVCAASARATRAATARATSSAVSKTSIVHPASMYGGIATVPFAAAIARRTAPTAGSTSSTPDDAPRRDLRQPRLHVALQPGHAAKDAAGEHGRKRLAAHAEPRDHRRRGGRELAAGARQDLRRHRVAGVGRLLHERGQSGDGLSVQVAVVDLVNQLGGAGELHVLEHHRRSAASPARGRRTAARRPTAPRGRSRSRRPRRRGDSPSRRRAPPVPRAFRPYAIDPVPATTTTPGSSPAPATSATSASLTTSVCVLKPMRRMMPRTASASAGRSTPAIPRQMAAGRTSARRTLRSAASITWCSTFSTSSSPADCRFAPPPRASAITVPRRRRAGTPSSCRRRRFPARASLSYGTQVEAAPCSRRSLRYSSRPSGSRHFPRRSLKSAMPPGRSGAARSGASATTRPLPPRPDDTIFDLASLTKVLATTAFVMQQVERGVLGLDDRVGDHICRVGRRRSRRM